MWKEAELALHPAVTVQRVIVEMTPKCSMMDMSLPVPPFQQPTREMCVIALTL